jgi:hypothetical protein
VLMCSQKADSDSVDVLIQEQSHAATVTWSSSAAMTSIA